MSDKQTGWGASPDPGPERERDTETVAVAIEPAGEYADDEIMVAALRLADEWRAFTLQCGRAADSLSATIRERVAEPGVVTVCASEAELLQAVTTCLVEHLDGTTNSTSENDSGRTGGSIGAGGSARAGGGVGAGGGARAGGDVEDSHGIVITYDEPHLGAGVLPVLRTRFARQDLPWPFWGCSAIELRSIVAERFNTQRRGETSLGLPAACEVLLNAENLRGGRWNAVDPVDSAAAARTAAAELRPEDLILHTVLDTYRVSLLYRIIRRYCPLADLQPEPVSPARQAHLQRQS